MQDAFFQAEIQEESFPSFLIQMETTIIKAHSRESFLLSNLICSKSLSKVVRTGCLSYYLKTGLFSSKSLTLSHFQRKVLALWKTQSLPGFLHFCTVLYN